MINITPHQYTSINIIKKAYQLNYKFFAKEENVYVTAYTIFDPHGSWIKNKDNTLSFSYYEIFTADLDIKKHLGIKRLREAKIEILDVNENYIKFKMNTMRDVFKSDKKKIYKIDFSEEATHIIQKYKAKELLAEK